MTDFSKLEIELLQSLELQSLMEQESLINEHIFGPVAEC